MDNSEPGFHEWRMMEDAKRYVRGSGQFRTARGLTKLFGVDLDDFRAQLERWKARCEVFSIDDGSEGELFPVFAFDRTSGIRPCDGIRKVLSIFEGSLSQWAIASWFIALNSYLDDQCPKDLIGEDPEWVVEAARDEISECSHG